MNMNSTELPHPVARQVLDALARDYMCILAGGYSAYKCVYTNRYDDDDIDIFMLIEK